MDSNYQLAIIYAVSPYLILVISPYQIGKIADFITELSWLAQFHPLTMKTTNSVSELSKSAQLHPFAYVALHVGLALSLSSQLRM